MRRSYGARRVREGVRAPWVRAARPGSESDPESHRGTRRNYQKATTALEVSRRKVITTSLLLSAVALLGSSPALALSPDIVISQVYGGGGNSGATLKNDFIELFNRGNSSVSIAGWSVQYASATGTTWQVTPLSGSIPAGGYYLVQEAQGAGGTTNLPTPDATGTIAMSATNGKVALVNSVTALSGACPGGTVDLVGYGTANCFETAATPALTNTTAALRNNSGCTETDDNGSDFATGGPNPRNSASPLNPCNPVQSLNNTWGRVKNIFR